jgi:hypothetical protein
LNSYYRNLGWSKASGFMNLFNTKVPHKTDIPTGIYKVFFNLSPAKRRMLPRLSDVSGFGNIPIHRGNTRNDSSITSKKQNAYGTNERD